MRYINIFIINFFFACQLNYIKQNINVNSHIDNIFPKLIRVPTKSHNKSPIETSNLLHKLKKIVFSCFLYYNAKNIAPSIGIDAQSTTYPNLNSTSSSTSLPPVFSSFFPKSVQVEVSKNSTNHYLSNINITVSNTTSNSSSNYSLSRRLQDDGGVPMFAALSTPSSITSIRLDTQADSVDIANIGIPVVRTSEISFRDPLSLEAPWLLNGLYTDDTDETTAYLANINNEAVRFQEGMPPPVGFQVDVIRVQTNDGQLTSVRHAQDNSGKKSTVYFNKRGVFCFDADAERSAGYGIPIDNIGDGVLVAKGAPSIVRNVHETNTPSDILGRFIVNNNKNTQQQFGALVEVADLLEDRPLEEFDDVSLRDVLPVVAVVQTFKNSVLVDISSYNDRVSVMLTDEQDTMRTSYLDKIPYPYLSGRRLIESAKNTQNQSCRNITSITFKTIKYCPKGIIGEELTNIGPNEYFICGHCIQNDNRTKAIAFEIKCNNSNAHNCRVIAAKITCPKERINHFNTKHRFDNDTQIHIFSHLNKHDNGNSSLIIHALKKGTLSHISPECEPLTQSINLNIIKGEIETCISSANVSKAMLSTQDVTHMFNNTLTNKSLIRNICQTELFQNEDKDSEWYWAIVIPVICLGAICIIFVTYLKICRKSWRYYGLSSEPTKFR